MVANASVSGANQLTLLELGNLSYQGIYEQPVTLKDGQYLGQPFEKSGSSRPRVSLLRSTHKSGDLNNDGVPEAVLLLAENSGGSGVRTYLAVVAQDGGKGNNIGTILIGDRVQIRALDIKAKKIVLQTIVAGKKDAACCPSEKVVQIFGINGSKLVQLNKQNLGSLSIEDLHGQTWRLSHYARSEPVEKNINITAVFADDKITGTSGCNKYFADAGGASPYEFSVSTVGGTRMACPTPEMQAEDRYLSLLQNANQFGFQLGKLAISYQDGEVWDTLLFVPNR